MMHRCYDKKDVSYKYYGAKGVIVCEEWINSYQSFLDWSLVNGWQKGLQIDKDKKGNGLLYSPLTCCWLTPSENMRHTGKSVKFLIDGNKINLIDISIQSGIERRAITKRLKLGWSQERAITEKIHSSTLVNFGAFKDGKLIYRFKTVHEAIAALGGDKKRYWRFLNGITKTTHIGFEFKFLNDEK